MLTNEQLIASLEDSGVLRSKRIHEALFAFPREKFVPADLVNHAYEDRPLPIGEAQTISQPYTVVFMLELLDAQPGQNVLEIGAGSGWQTAMLSYLISPLLTKEGVGGGAGHVWAYEINKAVGQFGKKNLENAGVSVKAAQSVHAAYAIADASRHWDEHEPYDRIIAGAAFSEIPDELRQLLKVGGRLVAPTQEQDVRVIERVGQNEFDERIYPGFV
ncbi:MAG: protein-L-isoaspartate O-methyltransferase, partial [Parcubacteria group bacterium]|nr:protein-L-isoaspartate O-methyltransferase [Parcubacteria group bacterium]